MSVLDTNFMRPRIWQSVAVAQTEATLDGVLRALNNLATQPLNAYVLKLLLYSI